MESRGNSKKPQCLSTTNQTNRIQTSFRCLNKFIDVAVGNWLDTQMAVGTMIDRSDTVGKFLRDFQAVSKSEARGNSQKIMVFFNKKRNQKDTDMFSNA